MNITCNMLVDALSRRKQVASMLSKVVLGWNMEGIPEDSNLRRPQAWDYVSLERCVLAATAWGYQLSVHGVSNSKVIRELPYLPILLPYIHLKVQDFSCMLLLHLVDFFAKKYDLASLVHSPVPSLSNSLGWLFLFSVLFAAGLLFTMVIFVRLVPFLFLS